MSAAMRSAFAGPPPKAQVAVKPFVASAASELAHLQSEAKLAQHSAYDWRVTAIQMAISKGDYATARQFLSPSTLLSVGKSGSTVLHESPTALDRSSAAGWEAGYYGGMLGRGDYSFCPKQGVLGGIQFFSTGESFITCSVGRSDFAGNLQLWGGTGGLIGSFPQVASARFSSEGDKLITIDSDEKILAIRSAQTGRQSKSIRLSNGGTIAGACDKGCLVHGGTFTGYDWVDFATGNVIRHPLDRDPLAISPDGQFCVELDAGKQLLIDSVTGKKAADLKRPVSDAHGYFPQDMPTAVFSANSRTVAVEQSDTRTVLVWSITNGETPRKFS
jgi:hypothetical protein